MVGSVRPATNSDQNVLRIGGRDGMITVRTIMKPEEIPSIVFVCVSTEGVQLDDDEDIPEIDVRILSYYTLAAARQRLREMGELT